MTCRTGPGLGGGFEPGSPAARTVASTHGAGAHPLLFTSLLLFQKDCCSLITSEGSLFHSFILYRISLTQT